MKVDWSRATIEKTTDGKGKRVDRVVYQDEKNGCSQCVYYSEDKTSKKVHHLCKIHPEHELKEYSRACVELIIKI